MTTNAAYRRLSLVLCLAIACAPAAAADPLANPVDAAVATADGCVGRLDHLRFCAGPKADRIAAVLAEGLAALKVAGDKIGSGSSPDKVARCRLDLMRGTLYLHAAEASDPTSGQREPYLAAGMKSCKATRIDYHALPLSRLGYVQEAHVHRLAGEPAKARAALARILAGEPPVGSPALMELHRYASLADLEIALEADPVKAVAEADALRRSGLLARQAGWLVRADWLVARAATAACLKLRAAGSQAEAAEMRTKAVELLRSEPVGRVAPAYDRLGALASLATAAEPIMTRDELLQWAGELVTGGRAEAVDIYRKIQASSTEPLPPAAQYSLALALYTHGRHMQAADVCDTLLADATADADLAAKTIRLRVASLMKAHAAAESDKAVTGRYLSALLALSDCAGESVAVRTDALRQWATLVAGRWGEAACAPALQRRRPLTAGDPHLGYVLATGWRQAAVGRPDGATADDAARVCRLAAEVHRQASEAGSTDLAARAALLRAIVLSTPPADHTHAALAVLNDQQPLLASCDATASAALWLRIRLLLDAGLIDEAVNSLPAAVTDDDPDVLIRVAGLLADRADALDAATRRRVIAMCNRALTHVAGDGPAYRRTARRAAKILLNVEANVDAGAILTKLLADAAIAAEPAAHVDCSLMMAESLRLGGEAARADTILNQLAAKYPDSIETHLARGRMKMALRQPTEAAAACRRARSASKAGSVPWCEATLELVKALRTGGHDAAAADILRVSAALYPAFGNAELKAELKRLAGR